MISLFLGKKFPSHLVGNLIVAELQVLLIASLIWSFAVRFFDFAFFGIVQAVIIVLILFSLFFEAKKHFKKQFKWFLGFFGVLFVLVQLAWIIPIAVTDSAAQSNMLFGLIFLFIVFFVGFKLLSFKKPIEGKVLSSNGKITVVETEFDLKSFVRGRRQVIETEKKYKEGQSVRVEASSGFFSTKIKRIIE